MSRCNAPRIRIASPPTAFPTPLESGDKVGCEHLVLPPFFLLIFFLLLPSQSLPPIPIPLCLLPPDFPVCPAFITKWPTSTKTSPPPRPKGSRSVRRRPWRSTRSSVRKPFLPHLNDGNRSIHLAAICRLTPHNTKHSNPMQRPPLTLYSQQTRMMRPWSAGRPLLV